MAQKCISGPDTIITKATRPRQDLVIMQPARAWPLPILSTSLRRYLIHVIKIILGCGNKAVHIRNDLGRMDAESPPGDGEVHANVVWYVQWQILFWSNFFQRKGFLDITVKSYKFSHVEKLLLWKQIDLEHICLYVLESDWIWQQNT